MQQLVYRNQFKIQGTECLAYNYFV